MTIDELRKAVQQTPGDWQLHDALGDALASMGREEEAIGSYLMATQLEPTMALPYVKVGKAFLSRGIIDPALFWLRRAMEVDSNCDGAMVALAAAEAKYGCRDQVATLLEGWIAKEPNNPIRRHLAAAIIGESPPPRAPDDYVVTLFDAYAEKFDDSLARLEYRGPSLVADALAQFQLDLPGRWRALDVGCGTGLLAPVLRPHSSRLVGVDLSGKMVAMAAKRGLYDEVLQMNMYEFMRSRPGEFDLLSAGDVLTYCGDLTEFCACAAVALAQEGWAILTLEALDDTDQDQKYHLNGSGRYSHLGSYVQDCLIDHGFQVRSISRTCMRHDAGEQVPTHLVVAQRMGCPKA